MAAPADEVVTVVMGHAAGFSCADGAEILVHIDMDTISLDGKGFEGLVNEGDAVSCDQSMIRFDQKVIADVDYINCVVVVVAVSNSAGYGAYLAPGTMPASASLCCAVGAYGQSLSEHVFAMVLSLMKRLPGYRDSQREHA